MSSHSPSLNLNLHFYKLSKNLAFNMIFSRMKFVFVASPAAVF